MIKLRKILLCDYLYWLLILLVLIYSLFCVNKTKVSIYNFSIKKVIALVNNYNIDGDRLNLEIKGKEKLIGTYYFKSKQEKTKFINTINLGDKILIEGNLNKPSINTTKNLFNYQKYLKRKNIYYIITIKKITIIETNNNLFFKIKNFILKRTTNPYLRTFILGDTSLLSKQVKKNYQDLGISHLFAISGMHIGLLSGILLKLLYYLKVPENKRYIIISILLIVYLLLIGVTPSILRAVLFFILFSFNKVYYLNIKTINIFLVVTSIALIINPNYMFEISFLYSFSISCALLILGKYINNYKHYISKLLITSFISFLVSLPITMYNFNQVNILSILYNLFFVPLISIVIFPFSLITFFCPFLESVLNFLINILEFSSNILAEIKIAQLIFCNVPFLVYIIYYFIIGFVFYFIINKKYMHVIVFLLVFLIHYFYPFFDKNDYIVMLDVGQGDSILLHSNNKTCLIDTGGHKSYNNSKWQKRNNQSSIVENITIPYLKKLGIKKLDYLVLTHGDYDHLGESLNLVKQFKVDKILINEGHINYLERKLINNFSNVSVASQDNYYQLGDFKMISLNYDLKEENDSSLIFYITIRKTKLLFMGDASIKSEEKLMSNYNLPKIDILKVGHHGSNTSSGKDFIKTIRPKDVLISVGENNKYHHPNTSVLKTLSDSRIYRTDKNGSIEVHFSKHGYNITSIKN